MRRVKKTTNPCENDDFTQPSSTELPRIGGQKTANPCKNRGFASFCSREQPPAFSVRNMQDLTRGQAEPTC